MNICKKVLIAGIFTWQIDTHPNWSDRYTHTPYTHTHTIHTQTHTHTQVSKVSGNYFMLFRNISLKTE